MNNKIGDKVICDIVEKIVEDIMDRRGLKHTWNDIERNIQENIKSSWAWIIRNELQKETVGTEYENGFEKVVAEDYAVRMNQGTFVKTIHGAHIFDKCDNGLIYDFDSNSSYWGVSPDDMERILLKHGFIQLK